MTEPGGFLAWYRRFYLLINLPVLMLITELLLVSFDPASGSGSELDLAMQRLRDKPPAQHRVVLLLGNSATRLGLDEDALERALGSDVRVYNFGLDAARLDDTFELAKLLIDDKGLRPDVVVLGVNPHLVDDKISRFSRFPWLQRRSPYVFFHRSLLRTRIKRGIRNLLGNPEDFGFATGGNGVQTETQRRFGVESFLYEFEGRTANDLPLVDDLPELVTWLSSKGSKVCVVLMPLSPDGTAKLAAYPALHAALRAAVPPDSLDLSDAYDWREFKDVGHVNDPGRVHLTSDVAAWLQRRKVLPR